MTALAMRGITKSFGNIRANDAIDLTVAPGEIHGLLGENGAGKSTLMSILFGLVSPDGGSIEIDDKAVRIESPQDAACHGIGMVHQHFQLVPTMTVAANLALATSGTAFRLDLRGIAERAAAISERHGLAIDAWAVVSDLSVGEQQRVEILKLLLRDARILVLDEPTAVLTPAEWAQIASLLRQLAAEGRSIVFISHKIREQFEVADTCTVLRHGKAIGTVAMAATDEHALIEMMIGRSLGDTPSRALVNPDSPMLLSARGLCARSPTGSDVLEKVDLEIRAGETLGIAGVDGNGQEELVDALIGLLPLTSGRIKLHGEAIAAMSPSLWRARGGALIAADRHRTGLALDLDLSDNLLVTELDHPKLVRFGVFDRKAAASYVGRQLSSYDVRGVGSDLAVSALSGGNQQKLVLARELGRKPDIVIAAQPTRGLDVGARASVHERLNERRSKGAATLLISTELDEVIALSDRIAVMSRGAIIDVLDNDESFDFDRLAALMAGGGAS